MGGGVSIHQLAGFPASLTLDQEISISKTFTLLLFGVFVVFLVLFIYIEHHQEQPMDLSLFRNPLLTVSLLTVFTTFVAIAGTIVLIPFSLENLLGYCPQQVGLLLAVVQITLGVVAPVLGMLSNRYGGKIITIMGLAVLGFGYVLLSGLIINTTSNNYVLRFLPIGIGMGIFQSPNNSQVTGSEP